MGHLTVCRPGPSRQRCGGAGARQGCGSWRVWNWKMSQTTFAHSCPPAQSPCFHDAPLMTRPRNSSRSRSSHYHGRHPEGNGPARFYNSCAAGRRVTASQVPSPLCRRDRGGGACRHRSCHGSSAGETDPWDFFCFSSIRSYPLLCIFFPKLYLICTKTRIFWNHACSYLYF
jgi:hypothetical protein